MSIDHDALVYSTEHGDLRRRQPAAAPGLSLPPAQQTAFLQRTSRGRGGKVVTLITNLHLSPEDQKSLARHLKQVCGTGGTLKDGVIEIQGDHRKSIAAALQHLGYNTKLVGG
jgi:translation initiation factor 1